MWGSQRNSCRRRTQKVQERPLFACRYDTRDHGEHDHLNDVTAVQPNLAAEILKRQRLPMHRKLLSKRVWEKRRAS